MTKTQENNMLRVVDEVLDTVIKVLQTPSMSDEEAALFFELLRVAFQLETVKDVEWHGVGDQFEEAIASLSCSTVLRLVEQITQAEFPKYRNRSGTIARYQEVKKYWQAARTLFE